MDTQSTFRRRIFIFCLMLMLCLSVFTSLPTHATSTPLGLTAADWQEIQAQLPQGMLVQQAYLKADPTYQYNVFGSSVAISGDTVVVGVPAENSVGYLRGAVYVFVRNGTTWSQQAKLEPVTGVYFGASVAINNDTIVVGAPYESGKNSEVAVGAAYIYVRNGTTWSEQDRLVAFNDNKYDEFGYSVAINGDIVAISAPFEDSSTTGINSTPD